MLGAALEAALLEIAGSPAVAADLVNWVPVLEIAVVAVLEM